LLSCGLLVVWLPVYPSGKVEGIDEDELPVGFVVVEEELVVTEVFSEEPD